MQSEVRGHVAGEQMSSQIPWIWGIPFLFWVFLFCFFRSGHSNPETSMSLLPVSTSLQGFCQVGDLTPI